MGWNDDKPWPKSATDLEQTNKDIEQYPIIQTPKPFGEVMKEFNEEAIKSITETGQQILTKALEIKADEIELAIPEGWTAKTVKAIQIGDLAIVTTEDEERCIAHVPTQTWFDNAVPDGEYTVEQLCLWAWKVQEYCIVFFDKLKNYNNETYKTIDKVYLERFKTCCLSVPVV